MNITIVGTGYVGLVTGTCFAEMGVSVTCVDIDAAKIEGLRNGVMPIYEPGLESMVVKNHRIGRLSFSTSIAESVKGADVIFCAVGTPSDQDGSADLRYVLEVAAQIGQHIEDYALVVTKSTVPVGTSRKIRAVLSEEIRKRNLVIDFDVASNPEFLKEGAAIKDFMSPDRVVVGVDSPRAEAVMKQLYKPFLLNNFRVIFMDIASAEMTKYASNAMLATRISFMNDIAALCEKVGADVNMVRKGVGSDSRIGTKFLYPGCGYGGSCFPKDVKALIHTAEEHGCRMRVIEAVEEVNNDQKKILFEKLNRIFDGKTDNLTVAVWGLSFKPETDDIREAPSRVLIDQLLEQGCRVRVYDPVAMDETRKVYGEQIVYCRDIYDAVCDCDAAVLITEWKEFRLPSWNVIRKAMRGDVFIDGRNIYDPEYVESFGIRYFCIGK